MRELLQQMPLSSEKAAELDTLQKHSQLAKHQLTMFKRQKLELQQNACLIIMDFSKFYTENGKVSDLILVLYQKNVETNKLEWKYLDHFAMEKQSFSFVKAVWLQLFDSQELECFDSIYIWSDGGPQHFKIKKTIQFFSYCRISSHKHITYNFFASGHGHSMCDSHTGVGKQKLLREERSQQQQTKGLQQVASSFAELDKTSVVSMNSIEDANLIAKGMSEGIKKYHEFYFLLEPGKVACREQTGVGPAIVQFVSQ